MNKKNKILMLVISIIVIVNILFGIYLLTNTKNENKNNGSDIKEEEKDIPQKEIDISFVDEETPLSDDVTSLFGTLTTYGGNIAKTKDYLKFKKKNDVYFISLREMNTKYNYDISMFIIDGVECDKDNTGIFFDTEKKLTEGVENYPTIVVPIVIGCLKTSEMM